MTLTVHVEDAVLVFRSRHYFLQFLRRRFTLPRWMSPGDIAVTHSELGGGKFSFTLDVTHPRFGLLIRQLAVFREADP